jgi:hypothetical protein
MDMMGIGLDFGVMRRIVPPSEDVSSRRHLVVSILAQLAADPDLVDVQVRSIHELHDRFELLDRATQTMLVTNHGNDQPRT